MTSGEKPSGGWTGSRTGGGLIKRLTGKTYANVYTDINPGALQHDTVTDGRKILAAALAADLMGRPKAIY